MLHKIKDVFIFYFSYSTLLSRCRSEKITLTLVDCQCQGSGLRVIVEKMAMASSLLVALVMTKNL